LILHPFNNKTIYLGESSEVLKLLSSNSIDSIATDPPAGVGLQGIEWDEDKGGRDQWISWLTNIMSECHRVLKPGAHGFVWALPRTSHWTAMALENAGFKVRDVVTHIFGSGFPKNLDLEKAITKTKHLDMDLIYRATTWMKERRNQLGLTNAQLDLIAGIKGGACHWTATSDRTQPAIPTLERWQRLEKFFGPPPDWMVPLIQPAHSKGENSYVAQNWKGWGTALKPASEHWILIQKPVTATSTAANVLKYGTGAINIDASRIPVHSNIAQAKMLSFAGGRFLWEKSSKPRTKIYKPHPKGRHPANLILTQSKDAPSCPVQILNQESPTARNVSEYFKTLNLEKPFVYAKKPDSFDKGNENTHPTVKPLNLMQYLIQMITPPNGVVLDPFMGSGTTGVACIKDDFQFIGIEKSEAYFEIAQARLDEALQKKEK
jgi:DNA modification methylase